MIKLSTRTRDESSLSSLYFLSFEKIEQLIIEPSDREVCEKKTGVDSRNYGINYTQCFRYRDIQQEVN